MQSIKPSIVYAVLLHLMVFHHFSQRQEVTVEGHLWVSAGWSFHEFNVAVASGYHFDGLVRAIKRTQLGWAEPLWLL